MKLKMKSSGSVEKYGAPEDHQVVSQNDESEFADLSPAASRSDMVAQSAFNHRDDGFDLNSLSIGFTVKADLHQPSIPAGSRFARGPSVLDWKD